MRSAAASVPGASLRFAFVLAMKCRGAVGPARAASYLLTTTSQRFAFIGHGMLERGSGYVLNTASAAGLLTQMDSGPYAVSKHAAVAFAEWLSIRYGDRGLGVSVLCPQAVRTNILGTRAAGAAVASARQAGQDGVLEPDQVALDCVDAIRGERFLVLPHPEVQTYFQRKADDYDRWLAGMRRFRRRLSAG